VGAVALWLVVFFALLSAARYTRQFWRGYNARALERRTPLVLLPRPEKRDTASR